MCWRVCHILAVTTIVNWDVGLRNPIQNHTLHVWQECVQKRKVTAGDRNHKAVLWNWSLVRPVGNSFPFLSLPFFTQWVEKNFSCLYLMQLITTKWKNSMTVTPCLCTVEAPFPFIIAFSLLGNFSTNFADLACSILPLFCTGQFELCQTGWWSLVDLQVIPQMTEFGLWLGHAETFLLQLWLNVVYEDEPSSLWQFTDRGHQVFKFDGISPPYFSFYPDWSPRPCCRETPSTRHCHHHAFTVGLGFWQSSFETKCGLS